MTWFSFNKFEHTETIYGDPTIIRGVLTNWFGFGKTVSVEYNGEFLNWVKIKENNELKFETQSVSMVDILHNHWSHAACRNVSSDFSKYKFLSDRYGAIYGVKDEA